MMVINYPPLKRKSLEQKHQRQYFPELAVSLALAQDDSLVCVLSLFPFSLSDLKNMHFDFGQLLLIPAFLPIFYLVIIIIKISHQGYRYILQWLFDGLIRGYSPALKSKSKEMNLKWKTKPPHQPKGGIPWKIDIQRDVSIFSPTNTLTGGMGRARRCGTVPEKVEGLDQVNSYVRESTGV